MLSQRLREQIKSRTEMLSSDEKLATAEGLPDDVLIFEYIRRHEEMKTMIKNVQSSFGKNMEGVEFNE